MFNKSIQVGKNHGRGLWPVVIILAATVIVPSACMLWFMNAAMQNTALAAREIVARACRNEAASAAEQLGQRWTAQAKLLSIPAGLSAPEAFEWFVASALADGFILRDAAGQVVYPAAAPLAPSDESLPVRLWGLLKIAQAFEQEGQFDEAAKAYRRLAEWTDRPDAQAQAMTGQARCLVQMGQKSQAIEELVALAGADALAEARDADGRLLAPAAALFALQLMGDSQAEGFRSLADELAARLRDYAGPVMLSSQRRFLMEALAEVDPSAPAMATLSAENLAAEVLAGPPSAPVPGRLVPTVVSGVYQLTSNDGRVTALLRHERAMREMAYDFDAEPIAGARLTLVPPGAGKDEPRPFLTLAAPGVLPGWTLRVDLTGDDPFAAAARRQKVIYAWIAVAGIVAVVVVALLVTFYLGKQMRLTRLKNDLIATVSHELKTPLSSIRLLVDTLLEDRCRDAQQAREYFGLIAKENERLSRLIDNFLNFSRMERNRRAFIFAPVSAEEILAAVMRALPDRVTRPPCKLEVDVDHDCPPVSGDRDALVTAILNLVDNAYKYSRDPRHIIMAARRNNGQLCLSVRDNGIGMSRRATRRVFDRFYQVDRSLSRAAEGCGLGLSIVKFIVEGHGGAVRVDSRLGEGSTFTVTLPALVLTNGNGNGNGNRNGNGSGGTHGC